MANLQEKDFLYKFWGGMSLFLGGAIISLILQLMGLWTRLSPVGLYSVQLVIPIWIMIVGGIMLVGMTTVKLWNTFRKGKTE